MEWRQFRIVLFYERCNSCKLTKQWYSQCWSHGQNLSIVVSHNQCCFLFSEIFRVQCEPYGCGGLFPPRKFGNKLSWMVPVAAARVLHLQCLLIGPVMKVGWSFMLLRAVIGHMEGFSTRIHRLDCGIPLFRMNILRGQAPILFLLLRTMIWNVMLNVLFYLHLFMVQFTFIDFWSW